MSAVASLSVAIRAPLKTSVKPARRAGRCAGVSTLSHPESRGVESFVAAPKLPRPVFSLFPFSLLTVLRCLPQCCAWRRRHDDRPFVRASIEWFGTSVAADVVATVSASLGHRKPLMNPHFMLLARKKLFGFFSQKGGKRDGGFWFFDQFVLPFSSGRNRENICSPRSDAEGSRAAADATASESARQRQRRGGARGGRGSPGIDDLTAHDRAFRWRRASVTRRGIRSGASDHVSQKLRSVAFNPAGALMRRMGIFFFLQFCSTFQTLPAQRENIHICEEKKGRGERSHNEKHPHRSSGTPAFTSEKN